MLKEGESNGKGKSRGGSDSQLSALSSTLTLIHKLVGINRMMPLTGINLCRGIAGYRLMTVLFCLT